MTNEDRIAALEAEVEQLRKEVELARFLSPACPLCHGHMSKSTKYDNYFCQQTYGPCGVLEFGVKSTAPKVYATFTRTSMRKGAIDRFNRMYPEKIRLRKFYVADKEVSEAEYFALAEKSLPSSLALDSEAEKEKDNEQAN